MKAVGIFAFILAAASASVIRIETSGGSFDFVKSEPAVEEVVSFGPTLVGNRHIPITRFSQDITGSRSNQLQYATGNGIQVTDNTEAVHGRGVMYQDEAGRMVQSDYGLVKSGGFSYTSPEGLPISLTYHADDQGFRAEGQHLPKSVEMPAEHAEAHRLALLRVGSSSGSSYNYEAAPVLAVKSSYDAPAPVFRVESSYDSSPAPIFIKSSGY